MRSILGDIVRAIKLLFWHRTIYREQIIRGKRVTWVTWQQR